MQKVTLTIKIDSWLKRRIRWLARLSRMTPSRYAAKALEEKAVTDTERKFLLGSDSKEDK